MATTGLEQATNTITSMFTIMGIWVVGVAIASIVAGQLVNGPRRKKKAVAGIVWAVGLAAFGVFIFPRLAAA